MNALRRYVNELYGKGWDVMSVLSEATRKGTELGLTREQIIECVADDTRAKTRAPQ